MLAFAVALVVNFPNVKDQNHKIKHYGTNACLLYTSYKGLPLNEIPYIGHKTDSVFERELAQWIHENNIQVNQAKGIIVDSIGTCVEMVNRGLGWAIVPEICLRDFHGNMKPLFLSLIHIYFPSSIS